jgi:hypothetical protein
MATPDVPVRAICDKAWYVNPDESALKPQQIDDGLLFAGPSLIHHATGGPFTSAADDGAFTVTGPVVGVKPLFKLETTSPYSTVNKTAAGYWSSKIATGDGSQAAPVTLAKLATLAPYGETTTLLSFGVGYANDTGNKATVSSVTFGGKTYELSCKGKPEATPSATPTPTRPTPPATRQPAPRPSNSHAVAAGAGGSLPVTGPGVGMAVGVGAVVVLAGIALFIVGRRRTRFEP